MVKIGTEMESVQYPLIDYAAEVGWTYVKSDEILRMRGGEESLLLTSIFSDQIQRLNPGVVEGVQADDVARRLTHVLPRIEGNLDAWEFLRGRKTVFIPSEKVERNVTLISEDWEKNTYHVTDELRFYNGTHHIRLDVAFFINGIPVLFVEAKAATKLEGIADALEQVRRYHREGPELMALMQIHTLTHLVQYYYGPTWSLSRKSLFNWRSEMDGGDYETLVKSFVHPQRLTRMLTDYILFTRKDDELSKVILRPHQMRAVERVVGRAANPEKQRGLVWHTQGSGKTYTMITAAKQIIENPLFENPTVLMLVDRNELEAQLFGNLASVGFGHVEVANSKKHLRELIGSDQRGLIVSMIHKFDEMPADLNTRKNYFVLVDEAHRTTGGDLGNYLMAALPNATYLGFTGTPIDKTAYGKGTFIVFGRDDPKGYLDKYSIAESIADKTTVPLHYTHAPNELQVDKETLEEEFLNLAEALGMNDVEELNRVLDKSVNLRNMLKNKDRMARVAEHLTTHYREVVEPMGFKAFLVAVDREACAWYKDLLDQHLPPEYSEVVYSAGHNDTEDLARFHLSDDKERAIRKAFRNPDQMPKILIVTEKLLTGFDAPILYCMYLDKPMRDHVLLQAIARVNRPYEDETGLHKPAGFVLDYVGIFDNLEKALAFDSEDVEDVKRVVTDMELLKKEFAKMMAEADIEFLNITEGYAGDKAAEKVLSHFKDEEQRHEFYKFFRELADIYEILSPDAFLRPFIDKYDTLSRMYRLLRSAYDTAFVDRELTRKTARLVQEHTRGGAIQDSLEIYEINEKLLERLEKDDTPDTVKIFNLLKSIKELINKEKHQAPYLLTIGERAEAIAQAYQLRQKNTQEALKELEKLIRDINQAEKERAEKNLKPAAFAIYYVLNQDDLADAEEIAREMEKSFEEYPHWEFSPAQERDVRIELYKVLLKKKVKDELKSSKTKETNELTLLVEKLMRVAGRAGNNK
ncbi:MAG TPA: deoxyribonuclease HsdR [Anaerolineaceae bacterium]|nr:deoxyribonuclease HsdR [Anaerolineaceae bacterium]